MIISCSRRTDIPAFYSDWFMNRLREGYVLVKNPVNPKQIRQLSLKPGDVDCIVFWTKDPEPMLDKLNLLQDYQYYFQFTLTPYGKEMEPNLPQKKQNIESFLKLADKIGAKRVIWRYDPILFTDNISIGYHVDRFGKFAGQLAGYAEKCVISFIDMYRHIHSRAVGLNVRPPSEAEMHLLAREIASIAQSCGMLVETCAEEIDLSGYSIEHGRCIDDRLIALLTGRELKVKKDIKQRKLCGCVESCDIGEYNTCPHCCRYCYANTGEKKVEKNRSLHSKQSPFLIGQP